MMRWLIVGRDLLAVWGAVTLVVLALLLIAARWNNSGGRQARAVLNWCELGAERMVSLEHGSRSPRNITGDHVDYFAIRVSELDEDALAHPHDSHTGGWYRGSALSPLLGEAVEFAELFIENGDAPWFLSVHQLRSADTYVWLNELRYYERQPTEVRITFARPNEGMVYYFEGET